MFLVYDLWDILNECSKELKTIGIQHGTVIDLRYRKIPEIGLCSTSTLEAYAIWIQYSLFQRKEPNRDALKYVVMHELLHTVSECINHNRNWIDVAKKVDEKYGYGIMGYQSDYDILHKNAPILNKLICPHCGGYWNVKNPSTDQRIKEGEKFLCPWCNTEYENIAEK